MRVASTTIDLNFSIANGSPFRPTRSCLKSTGPRLEAFTNAAIARSTGKRRTMSAADPMRSNARFATSLCPSSLGVSTWMSGSPATGLVRMRGPPMSMRLGATTRCSAPARDPQLSVLTHSSQIVARPDHDGFGAEIPHDSSTRSTSA